MRACCDSPAPHWLRRAGRLSSWALPGAILALMPKCPMCLAAYVALGTGVGLSIPTAAALRLGLLILSATALACLGVRAALRLRHRRSSRLGGA